MMELTRLELILELVETKKSLDSLESNDFQNIFLKSRKGNFLKFNTKSLLLSVVKLQHYNNNTITYLIECYKMIQKIQNKHNDINIFLDKYKSIYGYDYEDSNYNINFKKIYNLEDLNLLYKKMEEYYYDLDFKL